MSQAIVASVILKSASTVEQRASVGLVLGIYRQMLALQAKLSTDFKLNVGAYKPSNNIPLDV